MKATVFHGLRDVRVETVPDPGIQAPTDAVVRVTNAAICGSDLWFYRGISTNWSPGDRTGHEWVGVVEQVGPEVRTVKAGDFVIAPFSYADGTCAYCRDGLYTSCPHVGFWGGDDNDGGQGEYVRAPFADATLVVVPDAVRHDRAKQAGTLALTDVMGTGFHGAVTAGARNAPAVVVIGDGAVGLCAVQSARYLGAERIIALGHHAGRLELARRFGATETLDTAEEGVVERVRELTGGGALAVVEAVGNQDTIDLAVDVARPGGSVTFVGVPAGIKTINARRMFGSNISVRGGLAPVRAYLPELLGALADGKIDPGPVFDLRLPLERAPEGYAAMDQRRAVKVILDAATA